MEKSKIYYLSFIVCIFPIIIFTLSVINANIPYIIGILTELGNSLNDFPLKDLEYLQECSEFQYPSPLYTWPGTQNGCSCSEVSEYKYRQKNENLVFPGECERNQTLNGCKDIEEQPPFTITTWSYGSFCSKYYSKSSIESDNGYRKFLKNSVRNGEKCKEGFKNCGKLDDIGNYLCIPEEEDCPINDIIVSNKERDDLIDYEYIILEDNKFIYFTNQAKNKPVITKFKVTEGKVCADKRYLYTEFPQYILDNNYEYYGCRNKIIDNLFDTNVEVLDRKIKNEFFEEGNLTLSEIFGNYSEFPFQSLNAEMILYAKNYVGYDLQCLQKNNFDLEDTIFSEERIYSMENGLKLIRKYNKILYILTIFCLLIYIVTCYLANIIEEYSWKNYIIWVLITLAFNVAINIIGIMSLIKVLKLGNFPLCSNEIMNSKIEFFNSYSNKLLINSIIIVIVVNLQLVYTFFMGYLKKIERRCEDKEIEKHFSKELLPTF